LAKWRLSPLTVRGSQSHHAGQICETPLRQAAIPLCAMLDSVAPTKCQTQKKDKTMKKLFCFLTLCLTFCLYGQEEKTVISTPPRPLFDKLFVLSSNDTAKDFTVQMINGETITLSDLKGQVVLLNFWTTWCGPCIREFREFPSKIIEPFKDYDFVLLPISAGETMDRVKAKMTELKKDGVDFNVGIDPERSIYKLYAHMGVPLNFLIDHNGIIRYVSAGYAVGVSTGQTPPQMVELVSKIQELLDELEALKILEQEELERLRIEHEKELREKLKSKIILVISGFFIIAIIVVSYILIRKKKKRNTNTAHN
jgi:peroxiredoxin